MRLSIQLERGSQTYFALDGAKLVGRASLFDICWIIEGAVVRIGVEEVGEREEDFDFGSSLGGLVLLAEYFIVEVIHFLNFICSRSKN